MSSPKNHIYVIRDAAEQHWKLQITTYYSSSGDLPANLRWARSTWRSPKVRTRLISKPMA